MQSKLVWSFLFFVSFGLLGAPATAQTANREIAERSIVGTWVGSGNAAGVPMKVELRFMKNGRYVFIATTNLTTVQTGNYSNADGVLTWTPDGGYVASNHGPLMQKWGRARVSTPCTAPFRLPFSSRRAWPARNNKSV
jgi:hypothetical protein